MKAARQSTRHRFVNDRFGSGAAFAALANDRRGRYCPLALWSNALSTASVIAVTPVWMVGFGTGANSGEWLPGSGVPLLLAAAHFSSSYTPILNIIDGTPALMYSEKSSLAVPGGVTLNLSPKAAFSTFSAVATTAASLTTALVPSVILISGAGAFAMAATALAVRSIPSCILARTSGLKVLMVPSRTASSGMMLSAVPAWSEPMETTPNSVGSFSRLMTL